LVSRRQFLWSVGIAEAAALMPVRSRAQADEAVPNILVGVRLEPFVDPLFVPPVRRPNATTPDSAHYTIALSEFRQKVHRDLPPSVLWGFDGQTPGPLIVAERNRQTTVEWLNRLPERHRLLVDHSLDGAGTDVPEVRTTVHLHGGHVSSENDGYPEHWVRPDEKQETVYPNRQPGATLWYHDHAMGITRLNAMMGLAGMYLIHDPAEDGLKLPTGAYDVPIVIQDRSFDARGQILYPVGANRDAPWVPEFFGTHLLVNGRVSPFFNVEPRRYRFRFLNASNARVLQLSLVPEQNFIQIGSDGGLLAEPVVRGELVIAPGERVEAIVDFQGREGRRLMLVNHAPAPFPSGGGPVPGLAMQFRVNHPVRQEVDSSRIPDTLLSVPRLAEKDAVKIRTLKLLEEMQGKMPHRMLLDGRRFMDPVTEDPVNRTTELWEFVNTTPDAHPIHLHAVHFQLLDRRAFDLRRYRQTSEVIFSRPPIQAPPEERGWKDTILCPSGQVTRILIPFNGEPGRFVWHCHMLEHEDNEMMRPFLLRP